jgi:IMP dehydrogenase
MTPQDAGDGEGRRRQGRECKALLHKHRIEKVLVVNDKFKLRGMITVKDIQKAESYPRACKDSSQGRLRVGAAVGTGAGHR